MAISKNYQRLSSMKKKTKAISSNKAANINFKIFGKLKPSVKTSNFTCYISPKSYRLLRINVITYWTSEQNAQANTKRNTSKYNSRE